MAFRRIRWVKFSLTGSISNSSFGGLKLIGAGLAILALDVADTGVTLPHLCHGSLSGDRFALLLHQFLLSTCTLDLIFIAVCLATYPAGLFLLIGFIRFSLPLFPQASN